MGDAQSGNITPGLPSGWAANDIHIAMIESWDTTAVTMSGWTSINTGTHVCGGNNTCRSSLFWKRAQAGDPDPVTVTYTGSGTSPITAWVVGFRGVVTTGSPFDGTPSFTQSSGETTTVNAAAISTTVAGTTLVFIAMISDDGQTLTTMPSGSSPWTKGMYLQQGHTPGQDYAIGAWYGLRSGTGTQAAVQLALQLAAGSYGSQLALIPDPNGPTIFYFHDATTPNAGNLPAATTLSTTTPDVTASNAGTNRDMNQTIGTSQASAVVTTLNVTTLKKSWFRRFISRPLAAQTLPTGVWTIQGGASESNTSSNMLVWGAVIKVWRPSTGTVVQTLLDDPTLGSATEPTTSEVNRSQPTASIPGVAVNRGDMLVVELWAKNTQTGTPANWTNTIYYDGTTEGSATSNAAYLLAPGGVSFTVCAADPAEAGYVAVSAQSTQATVYWSSADPVLILQRQGGSGNVTGIPTDGVTYTNETIGDAQVIYSGAAASSYQKTGLTNGNTYYYKVFTKTGSGGTSCYASAGTTTVNALHPASAPPAWSYMLGGGSSPIAGIAGTGSIYTSTGAGRIVSLNTADGTQSWVPVATSATIQGWLTWLPIGSGVVIGGDQGSGSPSLARVYSVATATGNPNWTTVLRTATFPIWGVNSDADVAQASTAAQIKAWSNPGFQGVPDDLFFVATANTGSSLVCGTMNTNNKVFALKATDGVPQWVFNLNCTDSVDVFYGMPYVDYGRNWLYVASRAGSGGGQRSIWALDTTTGNPVACTGTDCNLGHLETSPTLRYDGSRVYVGDTSGNLYAMDVTATPLTKKWTDPLGFKINGFVWEDFSEAGRLYFSTADGKVRCRKDTGAAAGACANWTADSTVAGASTPLLLDKLFVGSTDGNVYQIDPATGGTPERSFAVPGGGTVGSPSTEDGTQLFVGTSGGKIFKINLVNEGGVWKLPP